MTRRRTRIADRDYLERTIATVRIHRDADNSWSQWANIFADEIERLWEIERALKRAGDFCARPPGVCFPAAPKDGEDG